MLKKNFFGPENLEKKNFFGAEKSAPLENTIKYDLFLHRCRFFCTFFIFLKDGADPICTV
jgi:hypothetical protein